MTIHKSQGSQADEVTVLLPQEESRLLTRELFYTAVTRAKERVRVVGSEAALRAAIERGRCGRRGWDDDCAAARDARKSRLECSWTSDGRGTV